MEVTPVSSRSGMTYSSPNSVQGYVRQALRYAADQSPAIVPGVRNTDLVDTVIELSQSAIDLFRQRQRERSVPTVGLGQRREGSVGKPRSQKRGRRTAVRSRGRHYSLGSREMYWLKRP